MTASSEVMPLLGRIEICEGLSDEERRSIANLGRVEMAEPDTELMTEGEIGTSMILVIDGEVVVTKRDIDGNPRELGRSGPGDVLGEMSLIEPLPRTATVRAATELRYFKIEQEDFEGLVSDEKPGAARVVLALARVLTRRQRETAERVVRLMAQLADARRDKDSAALDRVVDELTIEWET